LNIQVQIEQIDAKIREIVPKEAMLEQMATGFGLTEGPTWCGDYLLFSDIPRNRIVRLQMYRYGPEVTTFRNPSGNSNGLTLDRTGRLSAIKEEGLTVPMTWSCGLTGPSTSPTRHSEGGILLNGRKCLLMGCIMLPLVGSSNCSWKTSKCPMDWLFHPMRLSSILMTLRRCISVVLMSAPKGASVMGGSSSKCTGKNQGHRTA
jgi:hypothetical protein